MVIGNRVLIHLQSMLISNLFDHTSECFNFVFSELPFPRRRVPQYTSGRPIYVRYWSPFGKDMTCIANIIADTVRYGLRRLWWENRNTVVCPINSNIISLINKVIHDYRLHRDNNYHNFWNEWYEKIRGE